MSEHGEKRRPTRPGEARDPEAPRPPSPGQLRWSLPELLLLTLLTGAFLFVICSTSLELYFKNASIRPGVRFLGGEIGGLNPIPARERMESLVRSCFRFPILLELGETHYFLYLRDHFRLEIDYDALIQQARSLDQDQDLWTRAWRYLQADFEPVRLPWEPRLDREFSREQIAALISDQTESRVHAFPQPDGNLRVIVSNASDQVEAILDQLEVTLLTNPLPGYRVLRPGQMLEGNEEFVIPPDDPERGFVHALGRAEVALAPGNHTEAWNVARALERLHGQILNPDDQFSFSDAAGPFTTEEGYQGVLPPTPPPETTLTSLGESPGAPLEAPSPTSVAPLHVGTGVERLASTLFQALLRVGADVLERTPHTHFSPDLAYAGTGLDVRVLPREGEPPGNLVMRNRWDFPLRLQGSMTPDRVVLEVQGLQPLPLQVEVRVGIPEKVPYKTELIRDPQTPRGVERVEREGIDGFRVKLFRKLQRPGGVEAPERMLGDPIDYSPRPSRILLGTGDPEALRLQALQAERARRMLLQEAWNQDRASPEAGGSGWALPPEMGEETPAPSWALPRGSDGELPRSPSWERRSPPSWSSPEGF